MTSVPIQIPLIFDVSANSVIYAEEYAEESISAHFKFKITSPEKTNAGSSNLFINAMKKILYSDEAEGDTSGVLFYLDSGETNNVAGRTTARTTISDNIGDAIRQLLLYGQLIQHDGVANVNGQSTGCFGATPTGSTGIPKGVKQTGAATASIADDWYTSEFIDAGDNQGATASQILIRIASAHLMGHPFAQAYIQESTIDGDLSNTNFGGQIKQYFGINNLNIGGDTSDNTLDISVNRTNGVRVDMLQTIYEQLFRVNKPEHSKMDDLSGTDTYGVLRPLVFKQHNTVTFYIRPRLFLKLDDVAGVSQLSSAVGNALGISGSTYNDGETGVSDAQGVFNKVFSTTDGDPGTGFHWLTSGSDGTYSHAESVSRGALSQWQTNYTWSDICGEAGDSVGMFDSHIWKITVTLGITDVTTGT